MKIAATVPAPPLAYRSFRAERLTRTLLRKHAIRASAAAVALAVATFSAAMLLSPPASEASLFAFPDQMSCHKAGQSLAPWFENEQRRAARIGAHHFSDFDEMLTSFQDAQKDCAAGETEDAISEFQDLANQIAKLEESRSWRAD